MEKTPLADLVNLTGKVAVVTGAGGGIGLGIARRLHEAGANLVIADLDQATAEQAAAELNAKREDSALAVQTDVSKADSVADLFNASTAKWHKLDILVNNAGIFPFMPLSQMDEAGFMHVIDTNLRSIFLTSKTAAELMKANGGVIINVASIDSLHPSAVGLAAYDASKHGVWGLTKNIALELAASNIRVNAIAPGGVITPGAAKASGGTIDPHASDKIPMRRLGDPDEMGRVALFLASDLSSYMTGSLVVADGGMLLT